MTDPRQPWQPDQRKLGNWAAMFDRQANETAPSAQPAAQQAEAPAEAEIPAIDPTEYRPWTLQRGAGRPSMMIDFRRFDSKSGLWMGWQLAYPHLIAIDYIGEQLVSLDFGMRQIIIGGSGLGELTRHFQQGTVTTVQEYAQGIWHVKPQGPIVISLRRISNSGDGDGINGHV